MLLRATVPHRDHIKRNGVDKWVLYLFCGIGVGCFLDIGEICVSSFQKRMLKQKRLSLFAVKNSCDGVTDL
jgi:hypothetical protein